MTLTGPQWLGSAERIAWETRIMRRRVPLYKAGIAALRVLNRLTAGPGRPSLEVTYWDRVGPGGETYRMPKLETMTGRTDDPVTAPAALRARTSFASRLARTISADEWPQIIEEYRAWLELKAKDLPGLYSEFYTHGGSRTIPGGETNPAFRLARVLHDLGWRAKASKEGERRVLRKARVLRAQQVVKFLTAEVKYAVTRPTEPVAVPKPATVYTREVVAAVADFVKPPDLRTPAARGETTPSVKNAAAIDGANAIAHALPPPVVTRGSAAAADLSEAAAPPRPQPRQDHAVQQPAARPGARPPGRPGRSPRDGQSR